jgi:hypothetical protein
MRQRSGAPHDRENQSRGSESSWPDARHVGPQQVNHQIRQAIQFCWMSLPPGNQNIDEVERQVRKIFERAIRDFREDAESFGIGVE